MRPRRPVSTLVVLLLTSNLAAAAEHDPPAPSPNELEAISRVEAQADDLIALSDRIWGFEEVAFEESRSAEALAAHAESAGFRVERGVADIPTAFIAEYGSGAPIVGILGEFDALPGLSQNPVPYKEPRTPDGAGHGCGHNVFGVASLGTAIAVKQLIETGKLEGTVRFYGTPAEEK